MKRSASILHVIAHPYLQRSRANKALLKQVNMLENYHSHDIYACYPDFFVHAAEEKKRLLQHSLIVLQFPFYWYSVPSLLKEWLDTTLEYGFAYGPGGDQLKGKALFLVVTTGGAESAYARSGHNHFSLHELLRPLEQTAYLCGMTYCRPFIVHGVNGLTQEDLENSGRSLCLLMQSYLKNPEKFLDLHCFSSL